MPPSSVGAVAARRDVAHRPPHPLLSMVKLRTWLDKGDARRRLVGVGGAAA